MSNQFQYPFNPIQWQGGVQDLTGDNQLGIYTTETTQRFVYGTRFITWDGRVFKYSKSTGACYTHRLNKLMNTISSDANGIDYSVFTNAQSAGDREITLTNGSTAVAEDYLAGGLAVIKPTEGTTDAEVMLRLVVGNEAAAASGECRIFLETPIETAVTTSNYGYVMPSSYTNIAWNDTINGLTSFAGLAATYVSATGYNFWTQTWGIAQFAYQSRVGSTANYRAIYGRHDGSGDIYSQLGANMHDQICAIMMDNNGDSNGCTNCYLVISA